MNAVELRRIDPAKNMRRFYRLDVQPDLFGGVLLLGDETWRAVEIDATGWRVIDTRLARRLD
jgi:predicted DNA-binding WGR domain protein